MKTLRILIILIIIGFIAVLVMPRKSIQPAPVETVQIDPVQGCYVATLAKDVYTLTIDSQDGTAVLGRLSYKNFEKDSSSGSFVGTYQNGILVGDYSFASEGMDSIRQVAFKRTTTGFSQGFGPVMTAGNREVFTDINDVTYGDTPQFTAVACAQ